MMLARLRPHWPWLAGALASSMLAICLAGLASYQQQRTQQLHQDRSDRAALLAHLHQETAALLADPAASSRADMMLRPASPSSGESIVRAEAAAWQLPEPQIEFGTAAVDAATGLSERHLTIQVTALLDRQIYGLAQALQNRLPGAAVLTELQLERQQDEAGPIVTAQIGLRWRYLPDAEAAP